ncbi:MAG: molybdate ABC transporter permease subunit [Desulfamplus sp.]|nr:molybdate ABC transporter permease subunit [Desulfamplus sp.]
MEESVLFSVRLSLQVSLLSTILIIISGTPVAYILAQKNFKGKELLDMLFTLPLVLPPTVTGYYLIIMFGRNGFIGSLIYDLTGWSIMFTWYAAVLASYIVALPLMIKTARAAIESVDKNLIDASYALGLSEFNTALRVIFPLAKRGLIAGSILSFARSMGEFGATLMLAGNLPGKTDTMPLAIYSLSNSGEWSKAHLLVILMTVISGIFLYIANQYSKNIR